MKEKRFQMNMLPWRKDSISCQNCYWKSWCKFWNQEQAQASDLCRCRPESGKYAGAGTSQQSPPERAQASDFYQCRSEQVTSDGQGPGQWLLSEQAQTSNLIRIRPKWVNSTGPDLSQWPLSEQAQANNLPRSRCEGVNSKRAYLSQWPLWDRAQASDLHGHMPKQVTTMGPGLSKKTRSDWRMTSRIAISNPRKWAIPTKPQK